MDESTRTLTASVASGCPEALARLYESWFEELYRLAWHATRRDEAFCLDVVQDAMMRVIRSMPVVETEPALRAWLRRTVLSCAYDRLRREARQRRVARASPAARASEASGGAPDDRLAWIRSRLDEIDPTIRTMLIMRHRFGWTLARIGREFGLSTGAVDGRISRAVDALRRSARSQGDDR